MKHTWPVTAALLAVFILSQLLGLALVTKGADVSVDAEGNSVVTHEEPALGPRPQTSGFQSVLYLLVGVAIGTIALLILVRFRLVGVWKLWFFVAVWLSMTISIGALIHVWAAIGVALVLAAWKIWRPNMWIHNLTEVLVYSGIALLLVPILDVFYGIMLLLIISVYDAYAVWQSRHMVKMAQFQTESKTFAGLVVPYKTSASVKPASKVKGGEKPVQAKTAILGGGDIAFPMLFAGTVIDNLLSQGFTKLAAYGSSLLVVAGATAALFFLFVYAKKDQFYPAMPFITAGCLLGYGVLWLFL
jgi:presenilin-like A22 family membrane protease